MSAKVLLRTASGIMLFHVIGHSLGAMNWDKAPDAQAKKAIDSMVINNFNFMGKRVTIANFYAGYGYSMIAVLLFITILLWLLSSEPKLNILIPLALFLAALGTLEFVFFFPLPAICSLSAAILTFTAYVKR